MKILATEVIRNMVQSEIDHYRQYKVIEENEYCFCIYSPINNSITTVLIENVENMGYEFLHVQMKTIHGKEFIVARFTYGENVK